MRIGATKATQTRQANQRLTNFSGAWLPGNTLRVYYPIFFDEETQSMQLLVGAIYGYKVNDMKALGLKTIFIPSISQIDENAEPIGEPDIMYRFSKIAPIFVNGRKAAEINAANQRNWPDENMHRHALQEIENKYDVANNMQAVKPVIGKLDYMITTEALVVPMVNGVPQPDAAKLVSQPLNNKKITALTTILNEARFEIGKDNAYMEVEWNFPADSSKATSAQNATISGLTSEYRLEHQYPEQFAKIRPLLGGISDDSDVIVKRAVKYVDENKVKQALTIYSVTNSTDMLSLNDETIERLCKSADLVKTLGIYGTLPEGELKAKLADALRQTEESTTMETPEMPKDTVPSAATPVAATAGAPELDSLLDSAANFMAGAQAATSATASNVSQNTSSMPTQLDMTDEELLGVHFN